MKKLILFLILLNFVSCGKDGAITDSSSTSSSKGIFSLWTSDISGQQIDMSNGVFEATMTLQVYVLTSQAWIDVIDANSRDSSGMTAGEFTLCSYSFYMIENDTNMGQFALDTESDADTTQNNICLEYDSNCSTTTCAINADHVYSITGNVLTIQYFSNADINETFK